MPVLNVQVRTPTPMFRYQRQCSGSTPAGAFTSPKRQLETYCRSPLDDVSEFPHSHQGTKSGIFRSWSLLVVFTMISTPNSFEKKQGKAPKTIEFPDAELCVELRESKILHGRANFNFQIVHADQKFSWDCTCSSCVARRVSAPFVSTHLVHAFSRRCCTTFCTPARRASSPPSGTECTSPRSPSKRGTVLFLVNNTGTWVNTRTQRLTHPPCVVTFHNFAGTLPDRVCAAIWRGNGGFGKTRHLSCPAPG